MPAARFEWVAKLDRWVIGNPWHARVAPFFCWIIFLTAASFLPEPLAPAKPFIYLVQCVVTAWMLWRYRKLTPELSLRFHWTVIPSAVLLVVAWVVLGFAMAGELGWRWEQGMGGDWHGALGPYPYDGLGVEPNAFGPELDATGGAALHPIQELGEGYASLGVLWLWSRLLGMALIVPLFEEMFIRSAMLRGLHRPGATWKGLLQLASDLPVIGDWVQDRPSVKKAGAESAAFTDQFVSTAVGRLTVFAVAGSTLVFMLSHIPRDWPGCAACGVVWCLMLWWTNRPRRSKGETWATMPAGGRLGLGPIVWSHALTNALLWWYTVEFGEWRFL